MAIFLGETGASGIPMYYFQLVYVLGFIAAVGIGSLAWYNSKRPPGWEDVGQRPDIVPDLQVKNGKGDDDGDA